MCIRDRDLSERLNAGQVYREEQTRRALDNFFTIDNLTALREIALRRCADRANKLSDSARIKNNTDYFTGEHILVCLSPSPSNAKIIRTAARMARAFKGGFTALFVETPDFPKMNEADWERLRANIHLAEQLGATVETSYGEDVALQISEFARLSGVSKIILGRNNARRKHLLSKPTLTEQLVALSPNLDVYIIPDRQTPAYTEGRKSGGHTKFLPLDLLKSLLVLAAATGIGWCFFSLGFSEANIITVYILGVLVTAVITTQQIYSLASSAVSVLIFNYFFTHPRFTLNAYDAGYPATFLIMFAAAFITSSLAIRLKRHARQSAQTAFRTRILFDTNQLLQQARERTAIISVTANQLIKLLGKDIVFYPEKRGRLTEPHLFPAAEGEHSGGELLSVNEQAVAAWTFQNNKHAGATTNTLSNAKCLYLAVRTSGAVYGVVGIVMDGEPLDSFENSIVLSILGECALALENKKTAREKSEAALLAKNEQLRANLLRSISHDLRTPLTSISGNAGILLASAATMEEGKRQTLYRDIYDDSLWLINLVENLLSVTRIEDGTIRLRLSAELMDEVIDEALRHLSRQSGEHHITVEQSEEFLLAKMDSRLIVQVVINLVDNAVKYTPSGSSIHISAWKSEGKVCVKVADDGPGIPDEAKERIFEMFYTGAGKVADSRRSMGLGLALCKSIVNAHGGEITVGDNHPKGTVFQFSLPAEEVTLHE